MEPTTATLPPTYSARSALNFHKDNSSLIMIVGLYALFLIAEVSRNMPVWGRAYRENHV